MASDVGELQDRALIQDLMTRYGRALDERDWVALADCFVADVDANLGFGAESLQGREALVGACRAALSNYDTTQHLLSPVEVDIDGNSARVRCNVHATHIRQGSVFTVGGFYEDDLARTSEGWRIGRHGLVVTWVQGNP